MSDDGKALYDIAIAEVNRKETERLKKLEEDYSVLYVKLREAAKEGKFSIEIPHTADDNDLIDFILKNKRLKSSSDGVMRTISWKHNGDMLTRSS